MIRLLFLALALQGSLPAAQVRQPVNEFNGAIWGSAPDAVRVATAATGWAPDNAAAAAFPKELQIAVYRSGATIAGYKATVRNYFWNGKFFQATVAFDFADLAGGDLNYNVYHSVAEYYRTIHDRTLAFVDDCYDLLSLKYGPKEPCFTRFDPRNTFLCLDSMFERESWNLRYHPYDFYKAIRTQSYARWDFPQTSVIFSIIICAPDKQFDYTLSCASVELSQQVNAAMDSIRMKGM